MFQEHFKLIVGMQYFKDFEFIPNTEISNLFQKNENPIIIVNVICSPTIFCPAKNLGYMIHNIGFKPAFIFCSFLGSKIDDQFILVIQ